MIFSPADLSALWLTLKLATTVTVLLLLIGTPIAWWLANTRSWLKGPVSAIVALPLVLPPTVLGFYLLLALGPEGPVGKVTEALGLGLLPFTFWGWSLRHCFIPCLLLCSQFRMHLSNWADAHWRLQPRFARGRSTVFYCGPAAG